MGSEQRRLRVRRRAKKIRTTGGNRQVAGAGTTNGTTVTTINERLAPIGGARTATFVSSPAPGVSNKPMVPTAATPPAVNPSRPLRRHIGQPLGGSASSASTRKIQCHQTKTSAFGARRVESGCRYMTPRPIPIRLRQKSYSDSGRCPSRTSAGSVVRSVGRDTAKRPVSDSIGTPI